MDWHERLFNDIKAYCKKKGIKPCRGRIDPKYVEEIKEFCYQMKRKYKNEYRTNKREVKRIKVKL
jgi:hypothetical protein